MELFKEALQFTDADVARMRSELVEQNHLHNEFWIRMSAEMKRLRKKSTERVDAETERLWKELTTVCQQSEQSHLQKKTCEHMNAEIDRLKTILQETDRIIQILEPLDENSSIGRGVVWIKRKHAYASSEIDG